MLHTNCIPNLKAINIIKNNGIATIFLCGIFPNCDRFNILMRGCTKELCTGLAVQLIDQNERVLIAGNIKGNNLTLAQASIQALKQGVLHFNISNDYPNFAVMQDKLTCVPTPIIDESEGATRCKTATTKSSPKSKSSEV